MGQVAPEKNCDFNQFSGRHFESDGEEFLNRIQHVLSKYSVRPEYIEIEVTEGVLVKNVAVLEKCMNRLQRLDSVWQLMISEQDILHFPYLQICLQTS